MDSPDLLITGSSGATESLRRLGRDLLTFRDFGDAGLSGSVGSVGALGRDLLAFRTVVLYVMKVAHGEASWLARSDWHA